MSVAVLIPTQRTQRQLPVPPQQNAVASSSKAGPASSRPDSSSFASTASSPRHPHQHHAPTPHHDGEDFGSDVQVVIEVGEALSRSAIAKGKARSVPSSPRCPSAASRKFVCTYAPEECSKSFTKRAKLDEHMLIHTGERPHSCPHCSLSFTRPTHLQAHVRTHLPESDKPFECSKEGCSKRFWTSQHLRRHEDGCGEGRYQCTLCPSSFSLSHQLRSHHAADHSPPGTKPFPCTQPDCDKSFPTAQKLRQHAKMHDDTRYLCTHPSHPSAGLSFPTWSLLRTHINTAHPPSCPYDECKGRPPFKTKKGLKAHLKVHMEREEDDRLLGKEKDQPESDEGDGERRGRKRLRGHGVNDDEDREGAPRPMKKVRRRSVSVAGKDWFCEQGECGKGFKSKKAFKTHHSTVHLALRPFLCPHCSKTYGHNHLLQRHLLSSHSNPSFPSSSNAVASSSSSYPHPHPNHPSNQIFADARLLTELTGTAYVSDRKIACPFGREGELRSAEQQAGEDDACGFRFSRAYDLRRHLGAEHGVVVSEEEARGMAERLKR